MDDQEVLKMKRSFGKKRRSRNSFSSSGSLAKDCFELNQLLDGDNTMVYALVEVSNESKKIAKREKIPLNNRDLFHMMEKFVSAKRDKTDRKILRPSLKRKYGLEYHSCMKFSREQRNLPVNELEYQTSGISDKTHIIYKFTSETTPKKSALRTGNVSYCVTETCDSEVKTLDDSSECSDLKILYNRNAAIGKQRQRGTHTRTRSISRGTNTDIVQTPKVLEDVVQALNLNLTIACSDMDGNNSDNRSRLCFCDEGKRSRRQSFLLVPFIVANRFIDEVRERRSNSCEIVCEEEDGGKVDVDGDAPRDGNLKRHKSSDELRIGISQINIHLKAMENQKRDGDAFQVNERGEHHPSMESGDAQEHTHKRGEFFLEEVKTLQMRLNAIIESLGMDKLNRMEERKLKEIQEESQDVSRNISRQSDVVGKIESDSLDPCPSVIHHEETAVGSQDFSVQVMFTNTRSIRTASDETTDFVQVIKTEMLDKLIQFPSQARIEPLPQLRRRRRLVVCSKSAPHFQTTNEGTKPTKAKKTSSLTFNGKIIELIDCLKLKKLNLKLTGDDSRRTEEKARPEGGDKTTSVLFKKESRIVIAQKESDGQITLKPNGKVAKIKIIGSTMLGDKTQETGVGKIKVELNETNSIRISNKFTRRLKSTVNPVAVVENCEDGSDKAMNGSGKAVDGADTITKTAEEPQTAEEKPEVTKKPRPEERGSKIARKMVTTGKPGDGKQKSSPDPAMKKPVKASADGDQKPNSRLKKPITPIRSTTKSRGPEGSKIQAQVAGTAAKADGKPAAVASPRKASDKTKKPAQKTGEESVEAAVAPATPAEDVRTVPSDDSVKTVIHKPCHIQDEPLPPTPPPPSDPAFEPSSQAFKSIWALTKVILYKDGSQSFEVLEASSTPPGYHLNQGKKIDNIGNETVIAAVAEAEWNADDEKTTVNEGKVVENVGQSPATVADSEEKAR